MFIVRLFRFQLRLGRGKEDMKKKVIDKTPALPWGEKKADGWVGGCLLGVVIATRPDPSS